MQSPPHINDVSCAASGPAQQRVTVPPGKSALERASLRQHQSVQHSQHCLLQSEARLSSNRHAFHCPACQCHRRAAAHVRLARLQHLLLLHRRERVRRVPALASAEAVQLAVPALWQGRQLDCSQASTHHLQPQDAAISISRIAGLWALVLVATHQSARWPAKLQLFSSYCFLGAQASPKSGSVGYLALQHVDRCIHGNMVFLLCESHGRDPERCQNSLDVRSPRSHHGHAWPRNPTGFCVR